MPPSPALCGRCRIAATLRRSRAERPRFHAMSYAIISLGGKQHRERCLSDGEELMAHKKGLGSSRNGRDSNAKRLGVKLFDGQDVKAGMIIVRQRGTRFRPGPGTGIGRDDTIFAKRDGRLSFRTSGERRTIAVT